MTFRRKRIIDWFWPCIGVLAIVLFFMSVVMGKAIGNYIATKNPDELKKNTQQLAFLEKIPLLTAKHNTAQSLKGAGQETTKEVFIIQAGLYRNLENAEILKKNLAKSGFTSNIVKIQRNNEFFYRVQMGYYDNAKDARKEERKVTHSKFDVFVVKLN